MLNKKALLWTGGKDCSLVLHILNKKVDYLVTLVPKGYNDHSFKAHPIYQIKTQAQRLRLPILFIEVAEPYNEGYDHAFLTLKTKYHVTTVYTGDIDFYDPYPEFIKISCHNNQLELIKPLWHQDRIKLMDLLLKHKIEAKITYSTNEYLQAGFIGEIIDESLINKLKQLPIDLCGEKGEYHTMLLNSPLMID